MRLRKAEIGVIALTLLFLALTLGYQWGRGSRPADFSVRTASEKLAERERAAEAAPGPQEQQSTEAVVNINTAGAEELCGLSGIGEVLAERIIAFRAENGPFSCIEDITKVSGIGSSTFERIQDRITVG